MKYVYIYKFLKNIYIYPIPQKTSFDSLISTFISSYALTWNDSLRLWPAFPVAVLLGIVHSVPVKVVVSSNIRYGSLQPDAGPRVFQLPQRCQWFCWWVHGGWWCSETNMTNWMCPLALICRGQVVAYLQAPWRRTSAWRFVPSRSVPQRWLMLGWLRNVGDVELSIFSPTN